MLISAEGLYSDKGMPRISTLRALRLSVGTLIWLAPQRTFSYKVDTSFDLLISH